MLSDCLYNIQLKTNLTSVSVKALCHFILSTMLTHMLACVLATHTLAFIQSYRGQLLLWYWLPCWKLRYLSDIKHRYINCVLHWFQNKPTVTKTITTDLLFTLGLSGRELNRRVCKLLFLLRRKSWTFVPECPPFNSLYKGRMFCTDTLNVRVTARLNPDIFSTMSELSTKQCIV